MANIVEYYNQLDSNLKEAEAISKTFINFYLYFRRMHEKKYISNNTLYFLDSALDFSEYLTDNVSSTRDYLMAKQFQLEQFLIGFKLNYNKFVKNFKKTFDIPASYSYEEVCDLIKKSYIAYASIRYKHNLQNSKVLTETFTGEKQFYKVPKYIPDTNANISECLELASGIKLLSLDVATYELFNIFNENLHIRTIVDEADGQIIALFVNGEEITDVPSSYIRKLKQQIKKGNTPSKNDIKPSKK